MSCLDTEVRFGGTCPELTALSRSFPTAAPWDLVQGCSGLRSRPLPAEAQEEGLGPMRFCGEALALGAHRPCWGVLGRGLLVGPSSVALGTRLGPSSLQWPSRTDRPWRGASVTLVGQRARGWGGWHCGATPASPRWPTSLSAPGPSFVELGSNLLRLP